KSSKDLEDIIESQRSDKDKEGVRYNAVPPLVADIYLSPKKDLSWTGLPEFMDDTVTDYSRPSPTVVSTTAEDQNKDTSTSEDVASPNLPKPFVKFIKPKDSQPESPEFVLHKKPCFNYGDFSHLANDCRRRVQREKNRPHGDSMRPSFRPTGHRPHAPSMNPKIPTMNGMIPPLIENFPLVEEIFPLPIGNFPLLAENLPLVAQNTTLLKWEGREKL
nr:hypothetical protein [Tanacetum cinerariifolium]